MTLRRDAKKGEHIKRWASFCEENRGLIERAGLPTPTIESQDRFADLLMHGRVDHHDDWSRFDVRHLSREENEAFRALVDRYFGAGYPDPGLMAVEHEERLRLAKKYPKQFDPRLSQTANRLQSQNED